MRLLRVRPVYTHDAPLRAHFPSPLADALLSTGRG